MKELFFWTTIIGKNKSAILLTGEVGEISANICSFEWAI
jgi:hypothetical protein